MVVGEAGRRGPVGFVDAGGQQPESPMLFAGPGCGKISAGEVGQRVQFQSEVDGRPVVRLGTETQAAHGKKENECEWFHYLNVEKDGCVNGVSGRGEGVTTENFCLMLSFYLNLMAIHLSIPFLSNCMIKPLAFGNLFPALLIKLFLIDSYCVPVINPVSTIPILS